MKIDFLFRLFWNRILTCFSIVLIAFANISCNQKGLGWVLKDRLHKRFESLTSDIIT